ncbi:MAG: sigma-70 family RNA polymerase sigma factor, partial [Myxococcota bacterium]
FYTEAVYGNLLGLRRHGRVALAAAESAALAGNADATQRFLNEAAKDPDTRIDALRRAGRPEPDPEDPVWVPSAPEPPDQAVAKRSEEARIREALDTLPEGQLEVLERAYMQGQTLTEVSEALNLPLGTVKSRVRLAMERLRGLLPEP